MEPFALRCECVKQRNTVYTHETEGKLHSCSSVLTFNLPPRRLAELTYMFSAVFRIKHSIPLRRNVQVMAENLRIT